MSETAATYWIVMLLEAVYQSYTDTRWRTQLANDVIAFLQQNRDDVAMQCVSVQAVVVVCFE